ncbi:MAG TPA: multicopper oxidase domain-containing protein [Gaiellaceae bacterium]|nr:multicopper oxidase domain-containing protein [Gaiellaceae bacterium]
MKHSTIFWPWATALLVAAAALSLGVVAVVRSGGSDADHMSGSAMNSMMHGSDTGSTGMGSMMGSGSMGMESGSMGSNGSSPMSEHMAPAPQTGVENATATRGGRPLAHTVDGDTWVFNLVAKPVKWEILPGTRVTAWAYNGTVPGPEIRVPYGQKVRVRVQNELTEPTSVHWHGIAVPNAMDGVPGVTQQPIGVGKTFTYTFRAIPAGGGTGGTFLYHSHYDEDRQVGLGLSAPLVIVPPKPTAVYAAERTLLLAEWNLNPATGDTRPPMTMEGLLPNYFTINGKSYPATEPINVKPGERVLLRLIGAGQFNHPMHLHGTAFSVVAKDGHPLTTPDTVDVVDVAPGERYDIAFTVPRGKWILHCHIGHHLTNNGASPGGLMTVIDATGKKL